MVKHAPKSITSQICEEKSQIAQQKSDTKQKIDNINQEYLPGKTMKKKDITKMGKIGPKNDSGDGNNYLQWLNLRENYVK